MAESSTDPIPFETDEAIARRLQQVENQLASWEAAIPTLRREIESIRRLLAPQPLDHPD